MKRLLSTLLVLLLVGVAMGRPSSAAVRVGYLMRLHSAAAILAGMFAVQKAVVLDPSRKKVIWTDRRAGKTFTVLADFMRRGLRARAPVHFIYIALTHPSAEGIAWPVIKELDERYGLGGRFQEQKLRYTGPGGFTIQLVGADRPGWGKRIYGRKLAGVAIDEAAFFSIDLRDLVDDYTKHCLSDLAGVLYLMSIPGHVPRGLFYELTKGFDYKAIFSGNIPMRTKACPDATSWSVHTWTALQNPHMAAQITKEIAKEHEDNPDCENDPRYQRNRMKAWTTLLGERVYAWDETKNTFMGQWKPSDGDHFVLGLDFGWDDWTALSWNVWRDDHPALVELESKRLQHVLLDEVASHVRYYIEASGGENKIEIVADPAHRQLFEEFRRSYQLPVMEAEKCFKYDMQSIANTWYREGRIQIVNPESSAHVEEMGDLVWKVGPDGKRREQPGLRNDSCDAHFVAFRHARHYLEREAEATVPDQKAAAAAERDAMRAASIEAVRARLDNEWYEVG